MAGLHIEDQVAPKKCGHIAGKQVIPTAGVLRQDPRRLRVPHRSRLRHHRAHRRPRGHRARRRDRPRQPLRRGGRRRDLLRGAPDRGRDPAGGARGEGAAARQHGASAGKTPAVKVSELERLGLQDRDLPGGVHGRRGARHGEARSRRSRSTAPTGSDGPGAVPDGHLPPRRLRLVARHRGEVRGSLMTSTTPTMFEKIWGRHVVAEGPGGQTPALRRPPPAARGLRRTRSSASSGSGRRGAPPGACVATADHYVPTAPGDGRDRDRRDRAGWSRASAATPRELRHHATSARGDAAPGHRARDRPGAGRHAARHHARVRRLAHLHPRRVRRARLRHRLDARSSTCSPRSASGSASRARCASRSTGARPSGVDGQGRDPRDHRADRRGRRRGPRDRVRGRRRSAPCRWTSA